MRSSLPVPPVLDRETAVALHGDVSRLLDGGSREVVLDAAGLERADAFGAAALLEIRRLARERGARLRLENPPEELRGLLGFLRVDRVVREVEASARRDGLLARIGAWGLAVRRGAVRELALCADAFWLTIFAPFHRRGPRFAHFVRQLNVIGTGSTAIVALISGLIGLIMALQAAYILRQFGANVFVADFVGVAMTRELGPLITAIMVAARCGSAMAAEIGTMVVTEEVEALEVMAVEPRRFLVAPRFAATAVVLPLLAVLSEVVGILGGLAVGVFALDLGLSHYLADTFQAIHLSDVVTGLVKSLVFANVIAVVSCYKGLTLRGGPEAVGRATTQAVVQSILLVIVFDFVFTTLFFLMD